MAEETKYKKIIRKDKEGNIISEEFIEIDGPTKQTSKEPIKEKKPFYKKMWFKIVAGLFIIGSISSLINPPDSSKETETKVSKVSETEKVEKKAETKTEAVTELIKETETETELITETEAYVFNPDDFETITYEELARNPEDHSFKAVQLEGKIVQVIEGADVSQYRLAVNENYDNIVLIEVPKELIQNNRILENDYIKVYGTSLGMFEYTSTIGGKISVPGILVDNFDFL